MKNFIFIHFFLQFFTQYNRASITILHYHIKQNTKKKRLKIRNKSHVNSEREIFSLHRIFIQIGLINEESWIQRERNISFSPGRVSLENY